MNEYSLYAAMLHLIYHSFAKIAVFFITGELMHEANAIFIDQLDGLGKKMPVSFICFILSGFSIAGIPMFSGFVSIPRFFTYSQIAWRNFKLPCGEE